MFVHGLHQQQILNVRIDADQRMAYSAIYIYARSANCINKICLYINKIGSEKKYLYLYFPLIISNI